MRVNKGIYLINIWLMLIFLVSCQSKSTVENEQNLSFAQTSNSLINTSTTTDDRNSDESKNTLDSDEFSFYKENYEREQSLRRVISNDYGML